MTIIICINGVRQIGGSGTVKLLNDVDNNIFNKSTIIETQNNIHKNFLLFTSL